MSTMRATAPAKRIFNGFRSQQIRSMATEAPLPNATLSKSYIDAHLDSAPTEPIITDNFSIPPPAPASTSAAHSRPRNPFLTTATCTLYQFPTLEPQSFTQYPSTHLLLPLRRDLLHRAVIYEGDMTRSGTANTKWRSEVHGSNRKIRPQKGTGSARLGDKKSPMLKGGGVAFGPKPRDFSTGLPKKVYDLAWRTALSYRYRRGELLVTAGPVDVNTPAEGRERYVKDMLQHHGFGHADGRTLFVAERARHALFGALRAEKMGREARALEVEDVDVKDLLELGRVVVERQALERMFREHESDLNPEMKLGAWEGMMAGQRGAGLLAEA